MSARFETHENAVLRARYSKLTYEQAAKYAVADKLDKSNTTVAHVEQDGDKVIIMKRMDKPLNRWYKWGFDQKDVFQRVTIDRSDKTVAIDYFNRNWFAEEPFVAKRDLFMQRADEPTKLSLFRHLYWVNKFRKFYNNYTFSFAKWQIRSAIKKQTA